VEVSVAPAVSRPRLAVGVGVQVFIALMHAFRVGSYLEGAMHALYYSYFSDVALPFGMYFLLCGVDARRPYLRDRRTKAALAFGPAAIAETLQGFGVSALGTVFDPLDFLMYAAGVLLAVGVDVVLLQRFLPGWALEPVAAGTS
jgi:hypothetical protein